MPNWAPNPQVLQQEAQLQEGQALGSQAQMDTNTLMAQYGNVLALQPGQAATRPGPTIGRGPAV